MNKSNAPSPPPPAPAKPVKPFNPLEFDATSPDSWASFAEMLRVTQGFVPSQEQFLAMVANWYQQQQQIAMMSANGEWQGGAGRGSG